MDDYRSLFWNVGYDKHYEAQIFKVPGDSRPVRRPIPYSDGDPTHVFRDAFKLVMEKYPGCFSAYGDLLDDDRNLLETWTYGDYKDAQGRAAHAPRP